MFCDLIHISCLTSSKEASLKAVKLSQSKMRYPNLWGLPVDCSSETLWQDLREQSTFLFSVIYLLGALCRHLKNRFLQATYWRKCQKNLSLRAMACLTWSDSRYLETRMTNAIWWKHWGWQWIIFELMRFYESFTYFA